MDLLGPRWTYRYLKWIKQDFILHSFKVVAKDTEALVKSTSKLEKEQKKTKKSTEDVSKSHAKYDKQNKSVYQGNLSSAKSFSKMKETIGGGSSGLVQAYATLAANVFSASSKHMLGNRKKRTHFENCLKTL